MTVSTTVLSKQCVEAITICKSTASNDMEPDLLNASNRSNALFFSSFVCESNRVVLASGDKIRIAGSQASADIDPADTDITKFDFLNGREFTVSSVNTTASREFILVNTTGLTFPDDAFSLKSKEFTVLSDPSTKVEA